MIKQCHVCNHTGELTWRDGKYYCAMCGTEISERAPVAQPQVQAQPQHSATVNNVTCPICQNRTNNIFDGAKYRCALCGTTFDAQPDASAYSYNSYTKTNPYRAQQLQELHKKKDKALLTAIILFFIFWPVAIYFFYKFYKLDKEIKALG